MSKIKYLMSVTLSTMWLEGFRISSIPLPVFTDDEVGSFSLRSKGPLPTALLVIDADSLVFLLRAWSELAFLLVALQSLTDDVFCGAIVLFVEIKADNR